MVPPKRPPPFRSPPIGLPSDDESTLVEPPKQLLERSGPIRSAPPPPRTGPPPPVRTVPPACSQTPAPWALPKAQEPNVAGPTMPPGVSGGYPSAPPAAAGPDPAPPVSPAGRTLPPSAAASPASGAIGAKTLAAWIGGAAAVGLLVSVAGAWVLLPQNNAQGSSPALGVASGRAPHASASAASSASAKPSDNDSSKAIDSLPSLVERAEQGDPSALEQIDNQQDGDRSVREALAWARGKSARKQERLESIEKALRSDLPLSADRKSLAKLQPFTRDPETATEALAILASLRSPLSADMLYDVWVGRREKSGATELAKRLLYTKEVRDSVSDALAVALDLRSATSCEEVAEILPRAQEHGDRRSLMLLGKLNFRYGCGRRGGQDCYPCLRGSPAINNAIAAVRRRPAPEI